MARVRIHHLARELSVSNNELIELLRELGEEVKSHSSTIDEETANAVRELVHERQRQRGTARTVVLPCHAVPVTELAERLQTDIATLMRTLMGLGIAIAPHQPIDLEIVVRLTKELGYEFVFERDGEEKPKTEPTVAPLESVLESVGVAGEEETVTEGVEEETVKEETIPEPPKPELPPGVRPERLQPRPPVVTVMGHVDHGKCVAGTERVMLADGRWMPICDLFDETLPIERDGEYERVPAKWRVLTYDGQVVRQAETLHVWRVRHEGHLIHLKLKNGDTLRVTPEHPLLTSGGWKRADGVCVGEYIAVPKVLPIEGSLNRFKELVVRRFANEKEWLFSLNPKAYQALNQRLASDKSDRCLISSYRPRKNKFRASELAQVMRLLNLDGAGMYDAISAFKLSSLKQRCCHREAWLMLPKEEHLPGLFYLLGAMYGDGCSGFGSLSNNDEEIFGQVEANITALGAKVYSAVRRTCRETKLQGWRTLKGFAACVFNFPLRQKSKTMAVPEAVQVAPSKFVSRFLQGYFDTDGYVNKRQCLIEVASASTEFLKGVKTLLLRFGIPSTLREGRYARLSIKGKSNLQRFLDNIGFTVTAKRMALESVLARANREGMTLTTWRHFRERATGYVGSPTHLKKVAALTAVLKGKGADPNLNLALEKNGLLAGSTRTVLGQEISAVWQAEGFQVVPSFEDVAFVKVCEVSSEPYQGYVYDLTVPDTHNFIANNIIAHNTTLLDTIRKTDIASKEFGQITQHIGAHEVEWNGRRVVFIDTPGHEAFTALRARGATVTDIVVLVVAADDGVMPQTVEAINHAKAAGVPIIVAINKIDRPDANPDRVKAQLAEHGLIPEEWGGDTICVPISALKGEGIDNLLEMISLVADLHELQADPEAPAWGYILESKLDPRRGPTATVIVQQGTLRKGNWVVAGSTYGRIRLMTDWKGREVKEARPSMPVGIWGLEDLPEAGDKLEVVDDGRIAKGLAEDRSEEQRQRLLQPTRRMTLEDFFSQMQEGTVKDLNLIIKGDVQGSADAITYMLERMEHPEVKVNIIHKGVGDVSENDVMLAAASNAVILGFNVRIDSSGRRAMQQERVEVRLYRIIYELVDDVKKAIVGMLEPIRREEVLGVAEVKATFRTRAGIVAGCFVHHGRLVQGTQCRVVRSGQVVATSRITSLRHFTEDRREIPEGMECGVMLDDFGAYEVGDWLEAFHIVEVQRSVDEIREKPPALEAAAR